MRYLPLSDADRHEMLSKIGVSAIDDLFAAVPRDKLMRELPNLPRAKGELEVEREMGRLAAKNMPASDRAHMAASTSTAPGTRSRPKSGPKRG